MAVLSCEGLVKTYGDRRVVDDIGFVIERGETYGLLGPNGAGKTTTSAMLCGLLEPEAGTVTVAGQAMTTDAVDAKRSIGLVPQDLALYPDLTARENLDVFARLQGIGGAELDRGRQGTAPDRDLLSSGFSPRRSPSGPGARTPPAARARRRPRRSAR